MIHKAFNCILLAKLVMLHFLAINAKVPAVIVFGDSSVDTGNNNELPTFLKSNFEPYGRDLNGGNPTGRFSNGRLPSDFISEAFGLKPIVPAFLNPNYNISDFATGVCFASAGTGYDNATSDEVSVLPLWKEVEYYKQYQQQLRLYLGEEEGMEVVEEALYLISIGTNDFLENYYARPGGRALEFSVPQYENFLISIAENFITELYYLGARKLSLGGLPPMGCLPLERTTNAMHYRECIAVYNEVAEEFNGKLENLVDKLNMELKGLRLVFSNPYDLLLEMIQKPSSFGFDYADIACCATGLVEMGYMCDKLNPFTCADAEKYVFWDAFHPTEKTNNLISAHLVKNYLTKFL
ncbi:GDSL esterase/lipase At2g04570-like [Silene latifolia]|uniref:GDSL esterase/lipase At2g04570-like n=1 Tax=Silene latifolia TaxID=37657 RepID=UPI003D788F7D